MAAGFIAVLRGINVSGKNRLPMGELVAVAQGLGWGHCETYIQSGNLIFEAEPRPESAFESLLSDAIERHCGMRVPVMVFSATAWDALIAANPFRNEAAAQPKTVHAMLISDPPSREAVKKLHGLDFGRERYEMGTRAVYLYLPDGMGRSKLGASIERILEIPMTGRNWNTMLALQARAAQLEN